MNQKNTPNLYQPLDDLLNGFGAIMGAAEYHGLLIGAICCGAKESDWQTIAENNLDIPNQVPEALVAAGKEMYAVYHKQLSERDFQFQLLLPPIEVELSLSTRCLGEWVTGFLAALGEHGIQSDQLPTDSQELLTDMAAIAQISIDSEGDNEQDFIEVVEYVRVAVFSLYEDLTHSGGAPKTLH